MSGRALAYRDPVLHFDALRFVALHEEGRAEKTLATENERKMCIQGTWEVPKSSKQGFVT